MGLGDTWTKLKGTINVTNSEGKLCVESVQISGTVDDLYDFDYYAPGIPSLPLSMLAATLQHGWDSGLSTGTGKGQLFWNTIQIDSTLHLYTYDADGWNVTYQYCYEPYK
jgi:hypothetical protein